VIWGLGLVVHLCSVSVSAHALRATRPISKEINQSVLINGKGWQKAKVEYIGDNEQNLTDEQVRKYLAMLKNQNRRDSFEKEDTVLDPVKTSGNFITKQLTRTTPAPITTEQPTTQVPILTEPPAAQITTEQPTTQVDETTQEATTENPNNSPKSGAVEMLVEDIVYSGHMIHWSVREQYLAISDIWGQKYLRFEEIPPATTTVVPDTTTEVEAEWSGPITTEAIGPVTTEAIGPITTTNAPVTTTEILTTTVEPLPYDIKTFEVSKDVVWLLQPQKATEGSYPLLIPVDDFGHITEEENDFIMAFGGQLHIAQWDMESSYTNMSNVEWHNTAHTNINLDNFHVSSPAWVDPAGKILIGSTDLRKFEKVVTNTNFVKLANTFEVWPTLEALSEISCEPTGMAWSPDNNTIYFSDGHTRNITKCTYDMHKSDASNCSTILNVKDDIFETAVPYGMATDENNHIWVAVAENDGKGAVIEIDPESNEIISTIDLDDPNPVDVVFGGEGLDFMYILSKSSLYKLTGIGVLGMHVPDFVWDPDQKKRSISLTDSRY